MKKFGLFSCVLLILCSCGGPRINEKYAAAMVKEKLSLPGTVTTEILTGGLSGAKLFKVTSESGTYVIRFLSHQFREKKYVRNAHDEIACLKIASQAGYGPHLYYADEKQAFIIMEYLPAQSIPRQMRSSDNLYIYLAQILQKIHKGPSMPNARDPFEEFNRRIAGIKTYGHHSIPLTQIESILATIKPLLTTHTSITPCHNDLNPGNLLFLGTEFKVVDYECAAQSDPYFDIATVALFYCVNPAHEHVLFETYLGRNPTPQETARLFLMKQVAMINYALNFLKMAAEKIGDYENLQVPSLTGLFLERTKPNPTNLEELDTKLRFAKVLVNTVIANSATQEFHEAVNLLH